MSKFNKLYNQIITEMHEMTFEDIEDEKIFDFSETDLGQYTIGIIQAAFNKTLNEYKQKFPGLFTKVKLYFDSFDDEEQNVDIFAEIFPEDLTTIRINMFPILQQVYYSQFSKSVEPLNVLDNILDQLEDGTYPDLQGPLIAHELAHILDMKENFVDPDPHNNNWINKLTYLTKGRM